MEKEANQLYRRPQITEQATDEEEGGVRREMFGINYARRRHLIDEVGPKHY